MSQDIGGGGESLLAAHPSLLGRLVIPAAVLASIVLTIRYFNDSRKPAPVAGIFAVIPQSAVTAQKLCAPAKQHAKVSRTIDAELGCIAISKALVSVSGAYFNSHFLGFSSKLELMQHYTIIITVLMGLEHFKNFGTGVGYVSNGFGLLDDGQKHAAIS